MSHTHFCDVAGHPWQCESSKCICICQTQMEQGDHSHCPTELRACSAHDSEQASIAHREQDVPGGLQKAPDGGRAVTCAEQEGWGTLQPISPEIDERLGEWFASDRESIGFCFLCGNAIPTEADFITETNTHDCTEGRLFEEMIRRGKP